MTTNRSDFTAWLTSIGGDPSQTGFGIAGGLQAVIDAERVSFPRRRMYALSQQLQAPGGAGIFNQLVLRCNVPTRIWNLAFDSTGNNTFASIRFSAAESGITTLITPVSGYDVGARNAVGFSQTAVAFTTVFKISEGLIETAGHFRPMMASEPFDVDANQKMVIQDPTANAATFWWMIFEEQLSGA